MPNAPVAASVTALPKLTRRAFLAESTAATSAVVAASALPVGVVRCTSPQATRPYQSRAFTGDGWYVVKSVANPIGQAIYAFRDGHELIASSEGPGMPADCYIGHAIFDRICLGRTTAGTDGAAPMGGVA